MLTRQPDGNEIWENLKRMQPDKAPGPDGMTVFFFRHFWDIVGLDVVAMVQEFFLSGNMLLEINSTNLVLILKIDNPSMVGQFRPISLCNVVYKLISKILTDRLKLVLPKLISPFQLAFVPGRLLRDNYIVAAEIFNRMNHKRGKGGWMAIKADMEKAYDRVEWPLLLIILECFGFHPMWINWIKQCISTSNFSVTLNGSPFGHFSPSRGICQGDPLSPLLFLLCSEVLSRLLLREEGAGNL